MFIISIIIIIIIVVIVGIACSSFIYCVAIAVVCRLLSDQFLFFVVVRNFWVRCTCYIETASSQRVPSWDAHRYIIYVDIYQFYCFSCPIFRENVGIRKITYAPYFRLDICMSFHYLSRLRSRLKNVIFSTDDIINWSGARYYIAYFSSESILFMGICHRISYEWLILYLFWPVIRLLLSHIPVCSMTPPMLMPNNNVGQVFAIE